MWVAKTACNFRSMRLHTADKEFRRGVENMKYEWINEYLLKMPGVTKDLQKDWNWIRYQIGGKMFAAICLDDNGKPYYIREMGI